jgi:hypothetical protein
LYLAKDERGLTELAPSDSLLLACDVHCVYLAESSLPTNLFVPVNSDGLKDFIQRICGGRSDFYPDLQAEFLPFYPATRRTLLPPGAADAAGGDQERSGGEAARGSVEKEMTGEDGSLMAVVGEEADNEGR